MKKSTWIFTLNILMVINLTNLGISSEINENLGVILGTKVIVRESSTTNSKVLAVLKEGEFVEILKWTKVKEKIGIHNDYWVKMKTSNNLTGFIFGAFIFDLKYLINKKWNQDTCSGQIFSIIFEKNNKFKIIAGCGEPGCGEPQFIGGGQYSLNGREIILTKPIGSMELNKLYLFKYDEMYVLDYEKKHIDDRSFIEREKHGICWGWR
jgi:hypothetical protein